MLSDRFITRHTPLEHLLLEPPVTELERELQRRLRGVEDQIELDAPLLDVLNDAGVTAAHAEAVGDLVGAARRIDSDDLTEGTKYLTVLLDRDYEAGQQGDLDELLRVCAAEDIVLGDDLSSRFDQLHAMRRALERLLDAIELGAPDLAAIAAEARELSAEA